VRFARQQHLLHVVLGGSEIAETTHQHSEGLRRRLRQQPLDGGGSAQEALIPDEARRASRPELAAHSQAFVRDRSLPIVGSAPPHAQEAVGVLIAEEEHRWDGIAHPHHLRVDIDPSIA
jgi:hypothetical protein